MNAIEIVRDAFAAVEEGNANKFASMATDDMVFEGPVPKPQSRQEFLGLMAALRGGIPDWRFNARDFAEKDGIVTMTVKISGTQSKELKLPMLPNPVAASGKHFQLPEEHLTISLKGDKVSRILASVTPGGGVMGILAQLGISVPA